MPETTLKPGKTGTRSANATFQPKNGDSYTVATLPSASANRGRVLYCSNGSAGSACAVVSNGTAWKVIALGATAAAS